MITASSPQTLGEMQEAYRQRRLRLYGDQRPVVRLPASRRRIEPPIEQRQEKPMAARISFSWDGLNQFPGLTKIFPQGRKSGSQVLREIAALHGMTPDEIKANRRKASLVRARQHAMFEMYRQCRHLSLPMIGRIFGGKDHTTVLHAVRRHQQRLDAGETFP